MKLVSCFMLVTLISISSVGFCYGCCPECLQTRTLREYVPDNVCPSVIISEQRCILEAYGGCSQYGIIYRRVLPLRIVPGSFPEEVFCNATCWFDVCYGR